MLKWIKNLLDIDTLERVQEWNIERLNVLESAVGYKVIEAHTKIIEKRKPQRYDEIERDRASHKKAHV